MNGWANSGGMNGQDIGELSRKYETLIAPASYAFSIWGIIYLLLTAFIVYQWYVFFKEENDEILEQTGLWLALANLLNGGWTVLWLEQHVGWSVVVMMALLLTLIILSIRLRLELWDAPVRTIVLVWWPIVIYLGWIVTASVANVAAFFVFNGWDLGWTDVGWTILMMGIATLVYIFLLGKRNMREAAGVGIWAFAAIAVKHWETIPTLSYTAIALAVVLGVLIAYHGFVNRDSSPFMKLGRGEW